MLAEDEIVLLVEVKFHVLQNQSFLKGTANVPDSTHTNSGWEACPTGGKQTALVGAPPGQGFGIFAARST